MSPPDGASVTLLQRWEPHPEAQPAPTGCYFCRVRVFGFHVARNVYTGLVCRAILSPGDPYSVLLPVHARHNIQVPSEVIPHSVPLSWHGVPCQLVRVRIGLPVVGDPGLRPFRLLALLPTSPVEDTPPLLRLGTEFLHANRATVRLFTHPTYGEIIIPR